MHDRLVTRSSSHTLWHKIVLLNNQFAEYYLFSRFHDFICMFNCTECCTKIFYLMWCKIMRDCSNVACNFQFRIRLKIKIAIPIAIRIVTVCVAFIVLLLLFSFCFFCAGIIIHIIVKHSLLSTPTLTDICIVTDSRLNNEKFKSFETI